MDGYRRYSAIRSLTEPYASISIGNKPFGFSAEVMRPSATNWSSLLGFVIKTMRARKRHPQKIRSAPPGVVGGGRVAEDDLDVAEKTCQVPS